MSGGDAGRHPDPELLHRFAEGADLEAGSEAIRAHLRACTRCRREVAGIRDLRRRAAELPREIQPPRDLWPEVEARVRTEGRTGGGDGAGDATVRPLTLRRATPWLAAAAAVLVAVTAGLTLWLTDGSAPTPGERVAASDTPAAATGSAVARPAGLEPVREGYRQAVERLSALLEARDERLPPATREALERNLGIIDAAIAEAESALAADPASPERVRALERGYKRKVEMLRRSVRLTSQL